MTTRAGFATTAPSPSLARGTTGADTDKETGAYAAAVRATWRPIEALPDTDAAAHREVIRYATLAPSYRNAQPWKLRIRAGNLFIHPDFTRRCAYADSADELLFVGLGCAAENAGITARALSLRGEVDYHPAGRGGVKVALGAAARIEPSALFHAIPKRHNAHEAFETREPGAQELAALERCASDLGVHAVLLTDRVKIERLADLVDAANQIRAADPEFMAELRQWTRFSERDALRKRDGLFVRCAGAHSIPRWLGASLPDAVLSRALSSAQRPDRIRGSAGVIGLIGAGSDPREWIQVGRACQRLLLQATAMNLRVSIVTEPIEVRAMRLELAGELATGSRLPSVLVRFGYGSTSLRSLRRPVAQVML